MLEYSAVHARVQCRPCSSTVPSMQRQVHDCWIDFARAVNPKFGNSTPYKHSVSFSAPCLVALDSSSALCLLALLDSSWSSSGIFQCPLRAGPVPLGAFPLLWLTQFEPFTVRLDWNVILEDMNLPHQELRQIGSAVRWVPLRARLVVFGPDLVRSPIHYHPQHRRRVQPVRSRRRCER